MPKVCYLYNESITKYEFSKEHPMKTKRLKMAHSLIYNYNMTSRLKMFHSKEATSQQLAAFHHPFYIKYLESWVSPSSSTIVEQFVDQTERNKIRQDMKLNGIFKVNKTFDCPGFEGLYNFCTLAAGSSIDAADLILTEQADIAINWSGGYHHAKKTQASGFCYVNDIVLCILQLLKVHPRVLYLDIDVHHGDGVQEAFYQTNRVMTVSFHQFQEDFFPGTGALENIGEGIGKYYTVNVPLKKGIDDETYIQLFKSIMKVVMGAFSPNVLVIQCGADSLSKDRLGHLNLSIKGHAQCLKHMKSYGIPMILLGGGGYTIENVARCWAYQTGVMLGEQIDNKIPKIDMFYNYYQKQDHQIHFQVQKRDNLNTVEYLNRILQTVCENMRQMQMRPGICFHYAPKAYMPTQQIDWQLIDGDESSMVDEQMDQIHIRK